MKTGCEAMTTATDECLEQQVASYLLHNPEFFERHLELLETLRIPHPVKPAVSLIERRLGLLQEQNARLERRLRELLAVARDNDYLSRRMQDFTLTLIEAGNLEDLLTGICGMLRDDFNADFCALRLAATPRPKRLLREPEFVRPGELDLFAGALAGGRPLCGTLAPAQAEWLFQESAPRVASVALMPLAGVDWRGLLAVGSEDPGRFQPAMGSLFLARMGELVSRALGRYLRAPQGG
ncbi:MAG TPA: DUF484 family protein [Candidatus Competibacteraceae bacterium]|nr:DUF484 family protein [Candidatus Competibacteraceae bacterium]